MSRAHQPNAVAAERTVLGMVLLTGGKCLAEVAAEVAPSEFYDAGHRAVFEAMLAAQDAGAPVDVLTVAQYMRELGTVGTLNHLGGVEVLAKLADNVVTVEGTAYHARQIRSKAQRRAWMLGSIEITGRASTAEGDDDAFFDDAERIVLELSRAARPSGSTPIKPILHTVLTNLEQRYERREAITGVATGITKLDEMTLGLQPTDFIVLAGRPSMGKTAMAMGWAAHAAIERKLPVLVFSLEMSKEQLVERLMCSFGRVDSQRMRSGLIETKDWIDIRRAISSTSEAPIHIDDRGSPTLAEIRAECRRWRADARLFKTAEQFGLVVIDYLQLIQGSTKSGKEENRQREISDISRGLKALAKELRVPVVALSQLNRSLESRSDKRPMMSDLRESGAIEQDSDVVAFIYRDEVYSKDECADQDKGVAEIIIAKQRNGPTGVVRCAFLQQFTRFENLAPERSAPPLRSTPDYERRYP